MLKKIFLLLIAISTTYTSYSQSWGCLGGTSNSIKANSLISKICIDTSDGTIYAAGQFKNAAGHFYVAKWNGSSWNELGTGTNSLEANGAISTLCLDAAHNVYASGIFTNSFGKYYVAKWDGSTWTELGVGSNALNANASLNSICVDASGNLYAAGDFTDGVSSTTGKRYIAKWDGTLWSAVASGSGALNVNDVILSLAIDNHGFIYAAGGFTDSGYAYVAKWNGTVWSKLGVGVNKLLANGSIWSITTDDNGNIYSAGFFSNLNAHYYVAKWNGMNWNELGAGTNSLKANRNILSISLDKHNNVYAAGSFSNSDGRTYVAKWDGSSWEELGQGSDRLNANGDIYTTCIDQYFSVYAAGNFTDSIPGHGTTYVAKFDNPLLEILPLKNRDISIYPNPSQNIINLSVTDELLNYEYALTNTFGQQLFTGVLTRKNQPINISNYSSGIYFLHIFHTNICLRFLKQ